MYKVSFFCPYKPLWSGEAKNSFLHRRLDKPKLWSKIQNLRLNSFEWKLSPQTAGITGSSVDVGMDNVGLWLLRSDTKTRYLLLVSTGTLLNFPMRFSTPTKAKTWQHTNMHLFNVLTLVDMRMNKIINAVSFKAAKNFPFWKVGQYSYKTCSERTTLCVQWQSSMPMQEIASPLCCVAKLQGVEVRVDNGHLNQSDSHVRLEFPSCHNPTVVFFF